MKRSIKSILGVTLLEIMLVLAIAAMIIVMSVRYYQTASTAEDVNAALEQIQAISVGIDSLVQGAGTYASAIGTNSSGLNSILPANWWITPWGATMTVTATASGYTITIGNMPTAEICKLFSAKLKSNSRYSVPTCTAGSALAIGYS
jgi:type II secretory pathway pseudopilin PulG